MSVIDNKKSNKCFNNAVCTINSNVFINIKAFNNIFGGQLTSSLPGVRHVALLNNQRYCYIIYQTGLIVLTNLFYLDDMPLVYNFFVNLFILMLYCNVAHFKKFGCDNYPIYVSSQMRIQL